MIYETTIKKTKSLAQGQDMILCSSLHLKSSDFFRNKEDSNIELRVDEESESNMNLINSKVQLFYEQKKIQISRYCKADF